MYKNRFESADMSLLSIGIIVKNEEKKLPLCIDCLEPIRKAIDSTLIIADTGSTDGTKKVAKERADIFFEHKWNNDFSEARNALFSKVDSEWFMYIDADEIFPEEKSNTLIEFFASGDYKNYGFASVDIKTVFYEGYEHNANAIRLIKLTPETRFVGLINETFAETPGKCKFLDITLEHSGYMPDIIRAKEVQNVPLNRIVIEKEKNLSALIRAYLAVGDALCKYDVFEAEKAWNDGIRLSENADPYYKCALLARKMEYYAENNEHEKTLEVFEEYKKHRGADFNTDGDSDLSKLVYTDIEAVFLAGATAARSEDYTTAVKFLTKFEEYHKYYTENYERFAVNRRFYPAVNVSAHSVKLAAGMLTASCMKSEQFEYALSRLMKSPTVSNDITLCMDNINDFSYLPEFLAVHGVSSAISEYIPSAIHPIELTKALTEILGDESDFAIIYRYLTVPFDCEIETLHAKKIVIEYLTGTKSEPDDLEYLVNDYINHVYVTSDSIHYSDLITSARLVLAERDAKQHDI
jgi:glycosyltransferase involved in cell wall biosynthesis